MLLLCESWPIYVISFYIIFRQNELLNQVLVLGCFPISIFIETPSLEGLPTKSKEANSLHKIKLQLESNPVFFGRGGRVRGASTPVFLSRQHLKKGLPAKAIEASSLNELRLSPLDVDPVFPSLSIIIIVVIIITVIVVVGIIIVVAHTNKCYVSGISLSTLQKIFAECKMIFVCNPPILVSILDFFPTDYQGFMCCF